MAKVKLALIAKLEAKPGKEAEVESFLKGALPLVQAETGTIAWFAIRTGNSSFGILMCLTTKPVVRLTLTERSLPP